MNSNHVKGILAADTVVVTVIADHKNWKNIRGLQIFGKAQHLDQDERSEAEGLYLQTFDNLRHALSAPSTAAERKISERLLASDFFCIRPMMIRVIDNTKGFGHTEEFIVGDPPVAISRHSPAQQMKLPVRQPSKPSTLWLIFAPRKRYRIGLNGVRSFFVGKMKVKSNLTLGLSLVATTCPPR